VYAKVNVKTPEPAPKRGRASAFPRTAGASGFLERPGGTGCSPAGEGPCPAALPGASGWALTGGRLGFCCPKAPRVRAAAPRPEGLLWPGAGEARPHPRGVVGEEAQKLPWPPVPLEPTSTAITPAPPSRPRAGEIQQRSVDKGKRQRWGRFLAGKNCVGTRGGGTLAWVPNRPPPCGLRADGWGGSLLA